MFKPKLIQIDLLDYGGGEYAVRFTIEKWNWWRKETVKLYHKGGHKFTPDSFSKDNIILGQVGAIDAYTNALAVYFPKKKERKYKVVASTFKHPQDVVDKRIVELVDLELQGRKEEAELLKNKILNDEPI
jgi:hypothetical protein